MALKTITREGQRKEKDPVREATKAEVRQEVKDKGFPVSLKFKAFAVNEAGEEVQVGDAITVFPSYYEKSGRVAYIGGGDIKHAVDPTSPCRTNIVSFLPFSV